ncbi:hypothetical protein OS493_007043 [Desmophyllum pertusum]|uniref:Uncharacterized protein n=1 Tax=Desmophyllum pertusum TaxID=174260 RepID=A0A9W9ZFJ1_9CNID|nr:hypothetical protein OS493_007043 [Desmophyllum pertusum]
MAEYDGILVDGNFSLYRTPPEKCKNVQQITSWFVYKNIKPMLHRNVTLVMCYDKGKFVTLIKGQERQERWLKNNITNKQDHSLKLLQLYQPGPVLDNNHALPIGLVRSSRQVRDQYLHCIMKELFSNPSKYLPSNMEFVIVVDGGHALNEDAEDDVPVILYCDGKLLHKLIGFNAVNSHGEAEHVVFFYMLLLSSLVEKWAIISEDADSILKSLATSKERYQINGNSKLHVLVAPKGEHKEFSAYDVDKCIIQLRLVFNLLDMSCGDCVESVHNMSPAFSLQVLMALLSEDLVSEELDEETRQVVKELSYPPPHDLYPSFKQYQQIYKCRYFQKNRSLFRKESGKDKLIKQAARLEAASHCVKVWKVNLKLQKPEDNAQEVKHLKLKDVPYTGIQAKVWLNKEHPQDHLPNLHALQLKYQRACAAFFLCTTASNHNPMLPQGDMTCFGFSKIDDQKQWSVDNTKMNFGAARLLGMTNKKDRNSQCQAILQRGPKLGQQCTAYPLLNSNYCGRHKSWNEVTSTLTDDRTSVKHPVSPTSTGSEKCKKLRVALQEITNTLHS